MQRMDEWPAWQRWSAFGLSWALYVGGFAVLIEAGTIPLRVIGVVILCGGLWLMVYAKKAVLNERVRAVDRWHMRVTLPVVVGYILLMLYVWPLEPHIHTPWLRIAVALLPLLFLLVVIWAMARYIIHCDELERRQQLEAVGIAAGVISVASFALGLLAAAHLFVFNSALMLLLVFPALALVFGCVRMWSRWRNRAR